MKVQLNEFAKYHHEVMKSKGFWDNPRNVGELLMLIVSELGEGMEAHRKGKVFNNLINTERVKADLNALVESDDQELFKTYFESHVKDSLEDEIADTILRLFDLSAGLGIDLDFHIHKKLEYNKTRGKLHGKKY